MKNDILSWNDVKEKYLEFHKMDSFTENMAIDVDFGYWLVNNYIAPSIKIMCPKCNQPYVTYTADEYYECNSCDHTWI